MGDGDHGWAAAEFLSLVRDMFVRESPEGLVLLSGTPSAWFRARRPFSIADAPTDHGTVSVGVEFREGNAVVKWSIRRASHQEEARCFLSMPGDGARVRRALEGEGGEVAVRIADISKESI